MGVAGDWAVVLGASSGTGAAVATAVAERCGLHIFGLHRGNWPEGAAAVDAAVRATGRDCHLWTADATTPEAADEGARRLLDLAGPRSVKLMVHSVASASVGNLVTGDAPLHPRQLARTFERMAHSFVYWAQALYRHDLLAPGSHLLGLSNPMTETVVRNTALIAASKAALEMYVRHLAFELGPRGHRVNLLRFGLVVTPALQRTFPDEALASLKAAVERTLPARRLGTIDEVARFVAYLATDEAAWFNGATIDFTGGESQTVFDTLVYPDPLEASTSGPRPLPIRKVKQ